MKKWTYRYGENTIEVVNSWNKCELHVNGQVQDINTTIILSSPFTLQGKLKSGEEIRATIGGTFIIGCTMVVDNKVLQQNTAYPIEQRTIPMSANQAPVREVTIIKEREIVKIPCSHCSQLVDITADKCPNCGAKNTYYMR